MNHIEMIPMRLLRRTLPIVFLTAILALSFSSRVHAQTASKYWVWFADKGPGMRASGPLAKGTAKFAEAAASLNPRALARRAKVLPAGGLLDAADLPLYQPYIDRVVAAGGTLCHVSRWMNAASFRLTPAQVSQIASLPGVVRVTPVRVIRERKNEQVSPEPVPPFAKTTTNLDYGISVRQDSAIDIIQLHDLGITGAGVLIGMLDSGFRWRSHESLLSRDVIAEYDFVQSDSNVANDTGDVADQDTHGTLTFSTIGGYAPGKLIGPAFNAQFILGKTEWIGGEIMWEEDNWAAGIEWMERYGVDLVSCSLGYDTFQDTSGYSWDHGDFNGRTSITARAAVRAARLGVLVCTAMGNEYNGDGVRGTMLTPADADSVLSVGATTFSNKLAAFSSTGPTNDGRIKPDVCAVGASVYCAYVGGISSYWYQQGTSLATPLAAGAAALVLSARPELNPQQVINALHSTADKHIVDARFPTYPNNFVGWGTVDGLHAALSFGPIFGNRPAMRSNSIFNDVSVNVMSAFGIKPDSVLFYYTVGTDTHFVPLRMQLDSAMVYETSGRYRVNLPGQAQGTVLHFYVEARDSAGHVYRSPAPIRNTTWQLNYGATGVDPTGEPSLYRLGRNYPNPFNPSTTITALTFATPSAVATEITIYNILGQKVRALYAGTSPGGERTVQWDGNDDHGRALPSGLYICRMATKQFSAGIKMLLVR